MTRHDSRPRLNGEYAHREVGRAVGNTDWGLLER